MIIADNSTAFYWIPQGITLLTNNIIFFLPVQCLFPLVTGPLDNIHAILSSSQDIQGCKRKFYLTLEAKELNPSPKRWKKVDPIIVNDVKCRNVNVGDCRVHAKSVEKELLINDHKKQQEFENADKTTEVTTGDSGLSDDTQIKDPVSSCQDKPMDVTVQNLIQMVPTPQHLFWRNKHNFCWLDSLLVALACSRILKEASCENVCLTDKFPRKNYTVMDLCATYKKLYAYIKAKEQQCQG